MQYKSSALSQISFKRSSKNKMWSVFIFIACTCASAFSAESPMISAMQPRIINGNQAAKGQFPWQAALLTSDSQLFCGGVLINSRWVLTAAHCADFLATPIVLLGVADLDDTTERVEIPADKSLIHPNYLIFFTPINDIALVHLSEPAIFGAFVRPIKLSSTVLKAGVAVTVSGWGKTSDENSGTSSRLNHVNLVTISNYECSKTYGLFFLIMNDKSVCAKGKTTESGCSGDSGGPLIRGSGTEAVLEGIVSFGARKCAEGFPSAYTRIQPFKNWIYENAF